MHFGLLQFHSHSLSQSHNHHFPFSRLGPLSLSLSFLLSHFFIPSIIVYSFVSFSCLTTSFNFTFFFHLCIAPAINSCLIFVSHFSILLLILLCTGAAKHFSLLTSFHSPVYFICNNNYGPILMAQPFQSFTHSGHFSLDLSLSLSLSLSPRIAFFNI